MQPIISVRDLGKMYRIRSEEKKPYRTLRDELAEGFQKILQGKFARAQMQDFWAVKDINFDIHPGEVVGIIGRNGAGKSTLLKILSRITPPTTGEAILGGRVGSLLEVGTGFHPELTGRENVYLSGAIMGMSKAEINKKFDEIVAFAEVEKFIDTPVKRYSSGMYVRLAFGVAAHLEPEILIVDEVLAVGDAQFQKKCLGKMGDVASQEGRTVLFVSHQMGSIAQLCKKAILLSKGSVVQEGDTQEVIDYYLSEASAESNNGYTASSNSDKEICITKVQALNLEGKITYNFTHKEPILIAIECTINQWVSNTVMGFFVTDQKGRKVFTNNNTEWNNINENNQKIYTSVTLPCNFLVPGQYVFTFAISVQHQRSIDWVEDALTITIIDGGSVFSSYEGYDYGCVFADCSWKLDKNFRLEAG
ncbi:MAG TPA: ABC transporter ATP-binding protein [Candidatus Obscuribacterales bacterium]